MGVVKAAAAVGLLGRCCCLAGGHLSELLQLPEGLTILMDRDSRPPTHVFSLICSLEDMLEMYAPYVGKLVAARQLAVAGYALESTGDAFASVFATLCDVQDAIARLEFGCGGAAAVLRALRGLAQRLAAFGAATSTVPVRTFWNNPGCGVTRGQSEAELVVGR